ncbi:MAG: DNRLRE domain-containing protein [Gammaproteobacteria bacterium]|nr:DNRLRE domain-containing protein [Gammaproteobacteria bacterium]
MCRTKHNSLLALLATLCALSTALAQTVTRGPYLQMPTPNSVTVKWRTDQPTDSVAAYGTSVGSYPSAVSSASQTTEHELNIGGLQAGQQYFYTVGTSSGSLVGGDDSYTFVTPPPEDVDKATRIWVTGDAGTADANAVAVRDAYQSYNGNRHTDLFLTLGDIAYTHGTDPQYQAAFFDMYPQLLRQTPVWPTYGNHDGLSADAATETGPYFDIFTLPRFAEVGGIASDTEAYYSFDYSIMHFISLDSFESDRTSSGDMIPWLTNDLTANTKQWTIAFWHHPPYSKGSHDSDNEVELIEMRQNATALLESFGVDLVLTGHSHSYERSFLLDGHYGDSSTLTPAMILDPGSGQEDGSGAYIKPGMAGTPHEGAVYAVAGSSGKITNAPLNHPAMFTSLLDLGSLVLDIAGNRLEAKFLDDTGAVLDHFTLVKGQDTFAPMIVSAQTEGDTLVSVLYSEPMDVVSALTVSNYAIAGVTISQVSLQADQRTVELTTSPMLNGTTYSLTVNNVEDLAGNAIGANTQQQFTFTALLTLVFQTGVAPSASYMGARDAYLSEQQPDTNAGSESDLLVDGDDPGGSGLDKASLMAWDISAIPPGAVVESASVIIEVTNPTLSQYALRAMQRDWQESEATWNQYAAGAPWSIPGGLGTDDRGTDVLGQVTANATGTQTTLLNADGIALVQDWVDGTLPNYGFILSDTSSGDGLDFWSSEAITPTNRPRLSVEFQNPPSDIDNDGVPDSADNCIDVANGPLIPDGEGWGPQQDDDGDNVGNACDLVIPPQFIPAARVGNSYNHQVTYLRGQSPHNCSLIDGFLPANLTLGLDCVISGNVSAGGFTATFTVQVMDDTGDTAVRVLKLKSRIPNCVSCHAFSRQ